MPDVEKITLQLDHGGIHLGNFTLVDRSLISAHFHRIAALANNLACYELDYPRRFEDLHRSWTRLGRMQPVRNIPHSCLKSQIALIPSPLVEAFRPAKVHAPRHVPRAEPGPPVQGWQADA